MLFQGKLLSVRYDSAQVLTTSDLKWIHTKNKNHSAFRLFKDDSIFIYSSFHTEKLFVALADRSVFEYEPDNDCWLERSKLVLAQGYRPLRFPALAEEIIYPNEIVDIEAEYNFLVEVWTTDEKIDRKILNLFNRSSNFLSEVTFDETYSSNTRMSSDLLSFNPKFLSLLTRVDSGTGLGSRSILNPGI